MKMSWIQRRSRTAAAPWSSGVPEAQPQEPARTRTPTRRRAVRMREKLRPAHGRVSVPFTVRGWPASPRRAPPRHRGGRRRALQVEHGHPAPGGQEQHDDNGIDVQTRSLARAADLPRGRAETGGRRRATSPGRPGTGSGRGPAASGRSWTPRPRSRRSRYDAARAKCTLSAGKAKWNNFTADPSRAPPRAVARALSARGRAACAGARCAPRSMASQSLISSARWLRPPLRRDEQHARRR